MTRRTRRANAFTLVEVLVVIAIISLLVALLSPSLATARTAAKATLCAVQARQLQIANDLHAHDHNDRYAPGAPSFRDNLTRWHGSRTATNQPFRPNGAPLAPYLGGSDALARRCPSFSTNELAHGFEQAAGGYGYNNAFVGTLRAKHHDRWTVADDTLGSPSHRFRSPANTLAFSDAAFPDARADDDVVEYSFAEPRFNPANPAYRQDPSIHFRHTRETANIVALDGSAVNHALAFTWSSGFYAPEPHAISIGWQQSPDDNTFFDYD